MIKSYHLRENDLNAFDRFQKALKKAGSSIDLEVEEGEDPELLSVTVIDHNVTVKVGEWLNIHDDGRLTVTDRPIGKIDKGSL